ncbi:MAG: hypothetical protein P3M73_00025 [Candidatus Hodgkinia cicadicola]|nr:MAG: hypothetical protein P3M73_00025 [Candidatus Hodgkinia cicadicola]
MRLGKRTRATSVASALLEGLKVSLLAWGKAKLTAIAANRKVDYRSLNHQRNLAYCLLFFVVLFLLFVLLCLFCYFCVSSLLDRASKTVLRWCFF